MIWKCIKHMFSRLPAMFARRRITRDRDSALEAYWEARNPTEERKAYVRATQLGLSASYGESAEDVERLQREYPWTEASWDPERGIIHKSVLSDLITRVASFKYVTTEEPSSASEARQDSGGYTKSSEI